MRIFSENKVYNEIQFESESDFEREIVFNSKLFFGGNSIYIDAKRKIKTKNIGNSIPDGFLFDMSDKDSPEFYIVEVELAKHHFYNHIFPQVTKFLGFYKNPKSQAELVEKIFSFINEDSSLKKEFKTYLGENEIYKFLKDVIERSQNILLVVDGEKKELPEIVDTYTDTWGKMVKLLLIKKFSNKGDVIYTMHPEFESIEYPDVDDEPPMLDELSILYSEEYHLEGVSEAVRAIYNALKMYIVQVNPAIVFNPQKYYISLRKDRNVAFFIIGRKRMRLVVMQSDAMTRKEISHHHVKTLSEKVQKFWNGPSCAIVLETTEHLDEVKKLLLKFL